jgi:hypothetical protein
MKYATVELSKYFEHRYKFDALIYNVHVRKFDEVTVFLDTGCFNTMIPRHFAELSGRSLGFDWEMLINKRAHTFRFHEDPPDGLPNKTHIYQNYFNKAGNYVCAQSNE